MANLALPGSMSSADFALLAGKLALQLRQEIDAGTIAGYYEVLRDLPLDAVRKAQEGFSREKGRKWYPSAPEWLEAAQIANVAVLKASLTHGRDEPWHDECDVCQDTGWEQYQCDGSDVCGRRRKHAAHGYVRPCPCRPTNRTYQRRQQFGGE